MYPIYNNETLSIKYKGSVVTKCLEKILDNINTICEENDLSYFIWNDLLINCVHYEGVTDCKGDEIFDVGMERKDYEKFMSILKKTDLKKLGLFLDEYLDYDTDKKYKRILPRLGTEMVIKEDTIELKEKVWVLISPFDAIPEQFDIRSSFFRVVRRANRKYENRVNCRWFIERETRTGNIRKKERFKKYFMLNLKHRWRKVESTIANAHRKAQLYNGTETELLGRLVWQRAKYIEKDALYPLQKMKFGNIYVNCPNDYSRWTVLFDEKEQKRTKELQQIDLKLLAELDRVCKEIGVGYFICGGTMLGYVRHNGFIPWDDDIDVGLLRADYDKFIAEADKYLGEDFFLQTRESDPKIPYLFSKIRMNGTEYLTEYNENRDFHKGVCLDLFPFDYIPNEKRAQQSFMIQAAKKARMHHFVANRQKGEPVYGYPPINFKDRYWRFIGKWHRRIFYAVPLSITQRMYNNFVTQYNTRVEELGLTTVASFVPTYTYAKVKDMVPYRDIVFEGVDAKCLKEPEKFLKMQYGNYMELPPKHMQVGHGLIAFGNAQPENKQKGEE